MFGILTSMAAVLVANLITINYYFIFIISFLFSLNLVSFWLIYNILHFKYSEKEEHGFKSGAYFLLYPVLSVLLAPFAGLIVEKFGYQFLFFSSMLLYAIPLVSVFYLPNFDFEFATREAVSKTQYPILVAFQGYMFMLTANVISIFTLFFITTPLRLGNFFGYLAVFAAFAALFNSKISDRLKKRTHFFYVFAILNSLSYIPLVLFRSFAGWQIFSGINNFTYGLTKPFELTMTLDHSEHHIMQVMLGREVWLAIGKIFLFVVFFSVYFITSSVWTALVWTSLVPLLYPVIAYYQKAYLN